MYDFKSGLGLTLATAGLLTALTVQATPASSSQEGLPDDPAAAQLAADYGLTYKAAKMRIDRQGRQDRLRDRLRRTVPAFGGAYIDQRDGGRFVVRLTDQAARQDVQRQADGEAEGNNVRFESAARSLRDLDELAAQLGRELASAAPDEVSGMTAFSDEERNVVIVTFPSSGRSGAQDAFLADLQRRHTNGVLYTATDDAPAPAACSFPSCDPPLRGGLGILSPGAACTSGFIARDGNGVTRLITAGHCLKDSGSPNSWSQNGTPVGPGYRYAYGSNGDYGIITVNDPAFWASRGWVWVRTSAAVNGSPGTSENQAYPITGESQYSSTASTYLCHTGQTIGTRCGPKSGSNMTVSYPDATVSGLARFDAPVCRGDSGGPVYIQNAAYGVVSGGQTNATTPDCFTTTLFQGIGTIKSAYNLTLLHN